MVSRKSNLIVAGAAVAVLALVLASALGNGYLVSRSGSSKQNDGIGIEGVATITLLGSNGQTLNVWKAHNNLLAIDSISGCLSGAPVVELFVQNGGTTSTTTDSGESLCPGGSLNSGSFTQYLFLDFASCTSVGNIGGLGYCAVSAATNTMYPPGCPGSVGSQCTGWTASASFTPAELGCATTCTLTDVGTGYKNSQFSSEFDVIAGTNLPTITFSNGDSLAINIQFTVS